MSRLFTNVFFVKCPNCSNYNDHNSSDGKSVNIHYHILLYVSFLQFNRNLLRQQGSCPFLNGNFTGIGQKRPVIHCSNRDDGHFCAAAAAQNASEWSLYEKVLGKSKRRGSQSRHCPLSGTKAGTEPGGLPAAKSDLIG